MNGSESVEVISGVGPSIAKKLQDIGIRTIDDLVNYFPRKYDDYSNVISINKLRPGPVSIKAQIKQVNGRYVRRGMHITEAVASDQTGSVRLVWFNQPYRADSIKSNQDYFITGNFELSRQKFAIMNPSAELASDFPVNTARIIPIYKESNGLKSTQFRKIFKNISPYISKIPETLPAWIVKNQKILSRSEALKTLHFPNDMTMLEKAKNRIGFEEVFELTLTALLIKQKALQVPALKIPFNEKLARDFVSHLSFKLTDDQRKVIWQLYQDMQREQPMNRLVEGDVGSGKTVVATMAALMAMEQGYQVAFMAPTELLARQHAETIFKLLEPLGYSSQVSLLVGGMKQQQKNQAYQRISDGSVKMIIGTHALIQDKVDMHKLGLVIIDEQHRFGVEQRKKLQIKAGHMPHVLSMTATPIPRSLALTLYGEMDISIIASRPKNRSPIITKITSPNSRDQLYKEVDKQIDHNRQVFWVCPLVGDSASMSHINSAESVFKNISRGAFKHRRVGLLHGKMKADQKSAVMQDFIDQRFDILVATTVIEVGVDVPNATVMVIENADRFGLAQLHQLRGRVGRSQYQGYCYPILSDSNAPTKRLRVFSQTNDGFRLSELDLELRGPGAIYGTLQHGELNLQMAKLTDTKLISNARKTAQEFIDRKEKLLQYKHINKRVDELLAITSLN